MESNINERVDEPQAASETPEDVAILYSWANLHGAKYRDFSASRREYRAQLRHRAAEHARELEMQAQAEAEAAAAQAEHEAHQAEAAAQQHLAEQDALAREQALREAEEAARKAAAERVEAARRAEAVAAAEASARKEELEMARAHASAKRQAAQYAESDTRIREAAGPQPMAVVPGSITDPYMPTGSENENEPTALEQLQQTRYRQPSRERNSLSILPDTTAAPEAVNLARSLEDPQRRRPQGYRPDESSGFRPSYRPPVEPAQVVYREPVRREVQIPPVAERPQPRVEARPEPIAEFRPEPRLEYRSEAPQEYLPEPRLEPRLEYRTEPVRQEFVRPEPPPRPEPVRPEPVRQEYVRQETRPEPVSTLRADYTTEHRLPVAPPARAYSEDPVGPAWLYAPQTPPPAPPAPRTRVSTAGAPVADTLQHSRERVAARWFALKGVFDQPADTGEVAPRQQKETRVPLVAVFSLAGGVGKTSLVATLGRTLSSLGERVVLADTTSHGLLPFYFGASELRPGVVRTFSPPSGSLDAPISLVSYDIDHASADSAAQERLMEEFVVNSRGSNRTLLDLSGSAGWMMRRMARMNPTVLIPVAPDMNSVISLQGVEKFFQTMLDAEGRAIQANYVLNQFDASLPLHLDVREVLRRQLGDRLLPFVIRRSPAVSEALAEGMTVVDYAPETPVTEDYVNVANWVRKVSAPVSAGFRNVRWSER